ncbi:MAG TPA: phosphatidate cytidylyltransferase [Verrucomicrobiae bacterium]|nr:phosphatidate cytidylyltransferase [Verrucomicrobiae bacterium]
MSRAADPMLLQRVVTALALLPFVLGTLWFGSTALVTTVFGIVVLAGAYEWASLTLRTTTDGGRNDRAARIFYVAAAALILAAVVVLRDTALTDALIVATCLWWVAMLRWIATYPAQFTETKPPRWVKVGAGLVVIPGTIAAVGMLHAAEQGALRLMFALFLIWAADVGAYFAGRAFGKHKLAPKVSPGKSWEGVYGGVALSLVIAGIGGHFLFNLSAAQWLPFLLLCVAVVLFSIVGDLGESLLKRHVGAKDSGTLLPGHGGMLDRIDSLLAALPALAIGLRWLSL